MKGYSTGFAGIVLLSLGLTGCGGGGPGSAGRPAAMEPKETVFAVQVLELKPGDITNYIRVNGEVRSASSVDVFPDVAGKITQVLVGQGSRVVRGQTLLFVDPSRPGAEFVASPVVAPISGVIVSFPFSQGATVGPQTPVAKLARLGDLEVVANIAERFAAQVRPGLAATIELEAFKGRSFRATVASVAPVIDPLSRTLEIKLRIEDTEPALRSGMFADVRIVTEVRRNVIRVPSDAVVSRFGDTFVFVAREDGTAERRIVSRGLDIDNVTELVQGVKAGEKIVIRGQTLLEDGSKIRVIDQGGQP